MGKRQRERYRQSHGSCLCPVEALNPSFGQSALASPLTGIWTQVTTTGQACSGQPGKGRAGSLLAPPEETGLFTGLQSAPWRLECCAREEHLGGLPRQALSSQLMEEAWLVIHADRTGICWQAQADYSL